MAAGAGTLSLVTEQLSSVRAAFEDVVETYVKERRAALPEFITRELGLVATFNRVRSTAPKDVWRHPINMLLAVASLTIRKAASLADKLGFEWLARTLFKVPLPLSTDYQSQVQQAVVASWLGLADEANPLRAMLSSDPRIQDALVTYPHLTTALCGTDKLRKQLRLPLIGYVENRTTLIDLGSSGSTLLAASIVFGDSGLSPSQMVSRLAGNRANDQAASGFFLGRGAGKVFHKLFPVEPTSWEILLSSMVIFLGLSLLTIAVVLLTDPLLAKLGSHQRQLEKLLDSFTARLLLDVRMELRAIENPSAVPAPNVHVADRLLESASHLAALTQTTLQRTSRAVWEGAQPHLVHGLHVAKGQSIALFHRFMRLPIKWKMGIVGVMALFVVSAVMVRVQGKAAPKGSRGRNK